MASLERFKSAQASRFSGYASALAQIKAGRKTGHWIWYIFPQLAGLGRSGTAQEYAIRDLAEAVAYLHDQTLRGRLLEITREVDDQLRTGVPIATLLGSDLDAMKLVSSLTLFEYAAGKVNHPDAEALRAVAASVLAQAAAQGYARCAFTSARLQEPPDSAAQES